MTTVKEVLIQAKQKILKPEQWTQGAAARNVLGTACSPLSLGAVCFCAAGAVWSTNISKEMQDIAVGVLKQALSIRLITVFNDDAETTHADVLAAFDKAIAIEETK